MVISERERKLLIDTVMKLTGIDMSTKTDSFFRTRLNRVMNEHNLDCFESLLLACQHDEKVRESFVDRVTTHETYFFRTHRIWSYISRYLEDFKPAEFNAWSAASSTGEEIFSLAMLCDKHLMDKRIKWSLFATDISSEAISAAKRAQYQGRSIRKLQEFNKELIDDYFSESGETFQVSKKLTDKVSFKQHSLFDDHKKDNTFDLVLLRNVIIYFSDEKIKQILQRIFESLKPGGILILGESEGLNDLHHGFEMVESFIYKKSAA